MSDRVKTVDVSDPAVVLDCYRRLNVAYKELKAENKKLREALQRAAERDEERQPIRLIGSGAVTIRESGE